MKMFERAGRVALLTAAISGVALAGGGERGTIVDVAREAGSFRTLLAAVEAAGLTGALRGEGPYTVFAPTDQAFAALPAGTVEALLRQPEQLKRILLHHVARAARPASEVVQYDAFTTLAGTRLPIQAKSGEVRIGEARVIQADVMARNGVIHVIDRVLLPPPAEAAAAPAGPGTLVEVAQAAGQFKTLLAAAQAAGLVEALSGQGPLTVFAPSDAAFAALPGGALEGLLRDPARLRAILLHHVVAGRLGAGEVSQRRELVTLNQTALRVDARDGVYVGGARVLTADVAARNGVIHVIDRVLLPPPAEAPKQVSGVSFPRLTATNLEGRRFELPQDLDGELRLCLIAFKMWQQGEVDTWLEWLERSPLGQTPGLTWWEFPTGERMGERRERMVDRGMAMGIPSKAARERTITLWTDRDAFFRAMEIPSDRAIQVVLIDKQGRVLWRTTGRFSPEKGAELAKALGLDG